MKNLIPFMILPLLFLKTSLVYSLLPPGTKRWPSLGFIPQDCTCSFSQNNTDAFSLAVQFFPHLSPGPHLVPSSFLCQGFTSFGDECEHSLFRIPGEKATSRLRQCSISSIRKGQKSFQADIIKYVCEVSKCLFQFNFSI